MEVCGDKATTLATRVASLMDLCGMYALAGKKKEKSACWWASKSTYRDEHLLVVTFPRATGEGTNDRGAASGAASTDHCDEMDRNQTHIHVALCGL